MDNAKKLNLLVVGSGGREHALAWKIAQSPLVDALYCAPGNAGIARVAECVQLESIIATLDFCTLNAIDLVVIGPEAPLVAGLSDALREMNIPVFGCSKAAAQLEGSKGFTKDFCARHNIPTAAYQRFRDGTAAKAYVEKHGAPIVVKADGLAAGKGVTVAQTIAEAHDAIDDIFSGKFGDPELVVEAFLDGEEASFFALADGKTVRAFGGAQDHKTVGDGDTGPNTGGMGTYSPAPILDNAMEARVMDEIIRPTIRGMAEDGIPYQGVLFAGLMINDKGPMLIEYNVRFGDPETQVLMARLASDIVPVLMACAKGNGIENVDIRFKDEASLCVVMAAEGYPGDYVKGTEIRNLPSAPNGIVFHAGTMEQDGKILANGGRVLGVTAWAKDVKSAQKKAYAMVDQIDWPEGFCRRDIGWRAIDRKV